MRYIILLIAVFLSSAALAQEKEKMNESHESNMMKQEIDHEARAMIYADKMATRLGLSMEQKEMIEKAEMKRLDKEQKLMIDMMSKSDAQMEAHYKKVEDEFNSEMKDILTNAQYERWKPMHEREMKMHHKNMYNHQN